MTLVVGQDLLYVPSDKRRGSPSEVTVLKVGRKWAELSNNERIDLADMRADAGQYISPGRCYLSREAYEQECALNATWSRFKDAVSRQYQPPNGVTVETIDSAFKLLFKLQEQE